MCESRPSFLQIFDAIYLKFRSLFAAACSRLELFLVEVRRP